VKGGPGAFPETPRRFSLEGKSVDGIRIVCVVEIDGELVLVTAHPKRARARTGKPGESRRER